MSSTQTVLKLAKLLNKDVDEILITLWDLGVKYINKAEDRVMKCDIKKLLNELNVPTKSQLKDPQYWMNNFNIAEDEFNSILRKISKVLPKNSMKIPDGNINKIRKYIYKNYKSINKEKENHFIEVVQNPPQEVRWEIIGHETDKPMRYLSDEEVLHIHMKIFEDYRYSEDPIDTPGPKDKNIFQSAIFRPYCSNGGVLKYPTVEMAGAALLHSLILDHPFYNGNKRTAIVSLLVFLDLNGYALYCSKEELFKYVILIAQHNLDIMDKNNMADREVIEVSKWIKNNCRVIEKGEKVVTFVKLRRILGRYDCIIEISKNKANITRVLRNKGLLGRSMKLSTQIHYDDDGREVERQTISKLRKELQLDEDNGVDSKAFYDDYQSITEEYIIKYRSVLRRLSKW